MHNQLALVKINGEIFKVKKIEIKCPKSVLCVVIRRCKTFCYTTKHAVKQILWLCSKIRVLVEENPRLLEYSAKARILKLQDADHERDADLANRISAQ